MAADDDESCFRRRGVASIRQQTNDTDGGSCRYGQRPQHTLNRRHSPFVATLLPRVVRSSV